MLPPPAPNHTSRTSTDPIPHPTCNQPPHGHTQPMHLVFLFDLYLMFLSILFLVSYCSFHRWGMGGVSGMGLFDNIFVFNKHPFLVLNGIRLDKNKIYWQILVCNIFLFSERKTGQITFHFKYNFIYMYNTKQTNKK